MAGALAVLLFVVSISRVLLAIDKTGSSIVAIAVATLILAIGFTVAYRPKLSRDVIAGVVVVLALGVVAGGVIGATSGTRTFEHHGTEPAHAEEGG